MLHCSPITTVLLNKMGFSGSLSVSFPCLDPLIWLDDCKYFYLILSAFLLIYGIFLYCSVSLPSSELLQRFRVCLHLRTSLKHRKYLIVSTFHSSSLKR